MADDSHEMSRLIFSEKEIECRQLQILPRALRVKMDKDNEHETTDSRVLDISIDMNEVNKEFD